MYKARVLTVTNRCVSLRTREPTVEANHSMSVFANVGTHSGGQPMAHAHSSRTTEQRVVIAGAGRVGHRTAQVLDNYGYDVDLIERDPETVDQVTGRRTSVVIEGDATDPEILHQAKPEQSDMPTDQTGDGTTNFAICAGIQHLTDDIRTVARVDESKRADTAWEFADEIMYPERAGSKSVINRIRGNDIRTLADVTGDLDVLDIRVDPQSPVAGKQLTEILLTDGSQVISNADGTEIARAGTTLEPDRRSLVAAEPSVADGVDNLLIG